MAARRQRGQRTTTSLNDSATESVNQESVPNPPYCKINYYPSTSALQLRLVHWRPSQSERQKSARSAPPNLQNPTNLLGIALLERLPESPPPAFWFQHARPNRRVLSVSVQKTLQLFHFNLFIRSPECNRFPVSLRSETDVHIRTETSDSRVLALLPVRGFQ